MHLCEKMSCPKYKKVNAINKLKFENLARILQHGYKKGAKYFNSKYLSIYINLKNKWTYRININLSPTKYESRNRKIEIYIIILKPN